MKFTLTTALATLVGVAAAAKDKRTFAVLRFTNKHLTQGRMDPIVNPGVPSMHVHTVMGGSGFSLNSNGKDLQNSKCSNAMVKGDNSNYWFPSLYFKDPKTGKFEPVEVFYVNAYYFFEPTNDDIKAFPLGMSMVSGNATTRIVPEAGGSGNLDPSKGPINPARWTCPRSGYNPPSWPAGSDGSLAGIGDKNNLGEGTGFPDFNCDGYASPLRADVHFPSCYNPKAGLTNFAQNMAWPTDNKGKQDCPKGYIHVPHLFLEVYWNTPLFVNRWEQGKGHQPFVLSSGDATGFSSHADFMAGWDEKLLQHIIDTCDTGFNGMDQCSGLTYGLNKDDCTIKSSVDEKIDGVLDKLPGNNPVEGWYYGVKGSKTSSNNVAAVDVNSESSSSLEAATTATSKKATTFPSDGKSKRIDDYESTHAYTHGDPRPTSAGANFTIISTGDAASYSKGATRSSKLYAVTDTSELDVPKPTNPITGVFANPASKSCKRKVHTVYETVTVTQAAPESSAKTSVGEEVVKREHLHRHAHSHAQRRRGLQY